MDLTAYLHAIQQTPDTIPALRDLLSAAGLRAIHNLRAVDAGAPHLIVPGAGGVVLAAQGTDLDTAQAAALLTPYRGALSNIILTNGLDFIWLRDGQPVDRAQAGVRHGDRIDPARSQPLAKLLADFADAGPVPIRSLAEGSAMLGHLARLLRETIVRCQPDSAGLRDAAALMPGLAPATFADQYAQAVMFVLLAARLRHTGTARQQAFMARDVAWDLPPTNPFMRDFFREYDPAQLDDRLAWVIDLAAVRLDGANVDDLRREFRQRSRQVDLMRGFYDTFLGSYGHSAPAEAPEAAVAYIIRSVDYLLQKRFRMALGLADDKGVLLDPAAGTGTFLYFALQQVYDTLRQNHQLGAWDDYVSDALLPRLCAFESRLASYAIAHLKLSIKLTESGYRFNTNQRLRLYLAAPFTADDPALPLLRDEQAAAAQVRQDAPVRVIVGQTPLPAADTTWIDAQVAACYDIPPDDTLRLLAFGQWQMDRTGQGIVAVLIDGDSLHAAGHHTLRQALMLNYSDIYIQPAGDWQALFLIRRPNWQPGNIARVRYAALPPGDMPGWLRANDLASTAWAELAPQEPAFLFMPHDKALTDEYQLGWSLADIFPTQAALLTGNAAFHAEDLNAPDPLPVLAHPFDERWLPRPADGHDLLRKGNMALLIWHEGEAWDAFAARTPTINPACATFPLYRYPHADDDNPASPFPPGDGGRQPNLSRRFILAFSGRLNMTFIPDGHGDLKTSFGPQDVFYYVYALLHSPAYRQRYADLLPDDLPRVPLTGNRKLFRALVRRGRRLADRHLLRHARAWPLRTGFIGAGPLNVAAGHPLFIELAGESGGRVYINDTQYFEGVPRAMWDAHINGRQVLRDWLRAREGYTLTWHDLRRFQQIVVALRRALPQIDDMDDVIPGWPLP